MTVLTITEEDYGAAVDVAVALLRTGGTLVYPTDTVYGLGADATNADAVAKVLRMKGVEGGKPLSVMMPDLGMVEYYCDTGVWEDMILRRYLPGPYTFILRKVRPLPASETDTLGVRIPDSRFCRELCRRLGRPVVTTSANPTGKPPPVSLADVEKPVLDAADVAIDGGRTKYGTASTIIDLVERRMLRQGDEGWISLVDLPER